MKICVYAICKNEEKFAQKWASNMKEADGVFVLDTGSTDNTVKVLQQNGVTVKQQTISPWRFDVARNLSLSLLPPDTNLCVCTDLDELFEVGWRDKLEKAYEKEVKQYKYRYTWSFNDDGSEGVVFFSEKIHAYGNFVWTHPVHEVLKYNGNTPLKTKVVEGLQLNHHADNTKSRSSYLPLLELAVKENPADDRNMHYLGREYMFYKQFDKGITTLKRHLSMPNATWVDERCASMRYISKCYLAKKDLANAKIWLHNAIAQAPYLREPYADMATLCYNQKDWHGVIYFATQALQIKNRSMSYINEPTAWGSFLHDILSIAYFNVKDVKNALAQCNLACEISQDGRLLQNKKLFEDFLKDKSF